MEFDTTRMRGVLGITPRNGLDAMVEAGHSLIQQGKVPMTEQYKQKLQSKNFKSDEI